MRVVFFLLLIIFVALAVFVLLGNRYKVLLLVSRSQRTAYYTLNHRFLNFIQGKVIILDDGGISVMFKKNWLIKKDSPPAYTKILAREILGITKLTRMDVYLETGQMKDAFITSVMNGAMDTIGGALIGVLKSKEVVTKFHHKKTSEKNEIGVAIDLNIKITLLSFMFASIRAKIKYKKEKNNESKKSE